MVDTSSLINVNKRFVLLSLWNQNWYTCTITLNRDRLTFLIYLIAIRRSWSTHMYMWTNTLPPPPPLVQCPSFFFFSVLTQLTHTFSALISNVTISRCDNSLHLTTFCLQYKPTVVACVCIHLACMWSNWEIPKSSEGKDWFYYVDKSVTKELLEGESCWFNVQFVINHLWFSTILEKIKVQDLFWYLSFDIHDLI